MIQRTKLVWLLPLTAFVLVGATGCGGEVHSSQPGGTARHSEIAATTPTSEAVDDAGLVYGLFSIQKLAPAARITSPGLFRSLKGTRLDTCQAPLRGVLRPIVMAQVIGEESFFAGRSSGQLRTVLSVVVHSRRDLPQAMLAAVLQCGGTAKLVRTESTTTLLVKGLSGEINIIHRGDGRFVVTGIGRVKGSNLAGARLEHRILAAAIARAQSEVPTTS